MSLSVDKLTDAQLEKIASGAQLTPDDLDDAQLQLIAGNAKPSEPSTAMKAVTGVGKALDVGRGAITAPILAAGLEFVTGKDVYKPSEQLQAINPTNLQSYPTASELYERAGVPEGAKVSDYLPVKKDSFFDFTLRGAGGLGTDIAIDPLTYLSGGLSAAAKGAAKKTALQKGIQKLGLATDAGLTRSGKFANMVVNPIEELSKWRANKNYSKAFEELDRFAKQEKNATLAPSKIFKDLNFVGGMDNAVEKLREINKQAGQGIGKVLNEVSEKAPKIDLYDDAFKDALNFSKELRNQPFPEAAQLAKDIDDRILYAWEKSPDGLTVSAANELKSKINQLIKDSGFAQSTDATLSTQAKKVISKDLAESVQKAVEKADPKKYAELQKLNELYKSTSGSVADKAEQISNKVQERRGPWGLTQVDLALLGLGGGAGYQQGGGEGAAMGALGAKFLGRGLMTTQGRTMRGAMANKLSGLPVSTPLRRGVWESIKPEGEQE